MNNFDFIKRWETYEYYYEFYSNKYKNYPPHLLKLIQSKLNLFIDKDCVKNKVIENILSND